MVVKNIITILAGIAVVVGVIAVIVVESAPDLDKLRESTEALLTIEGAEAAGYVNVDVDGCVSSPEGAMGFHYVNFNLLDPVLDPFRPEILVFVPDFEGGLYLGAVEFAVPVEVWDQDNGEPPSVLGQNLHINAELGLYVLHAWIYEENPAGVFADWNPEVSCLPASQILNQPSLAVDMRFGIFNLN